MTQRSLRLLALASVAILLLVVPLVAVRHVVGDEGTPVLAPDGHPLAPPPLPYSPYGTVTINGHNVDTGTVIGAWCGGVRVAEALSEFAQGQSGYGVDIQEDNAGTPRKDGCVASEIVTFTVGIAEAEAYKPDNPGEPVVWVSGLSEQVNLTAEAERVYLPLTLR